MYLRLDSRFYECSKVYWWKHNCKFGQYAPIKVFKTLDIKSEKEYPFFSVTENPLPNLIPDIYIL